MREIEAEPRERRERQREERHLPVDPQERDERAEGGEDVARPARQLRADEVLHRRGVVHDPREQRAGLRPVEVRRRHPRDARHDAPPPSEHDELGREPEDPLEAEERQCLDERRDDDRRGEPRQEVGPLFADHLVEQHLRRDRNDESRGPIDEEEGQPRGELAPLSPDDRLRQLPGRRGRLLRHHRRCL